MPATDHFRECYRAFRPTPEIRTLLWAIENISNADGRPYDHAHYPHLAAPGSPMDAFDDPRVRTISLQFATRLGKTFMGQVCLTKTADTDPAPMMFASSVESVAKEGIARLYTSVRQNKRLNDLLVKNEREQRQDLVEFRGSKIYVAWSRSVSTLGDKNIKVMHGGEWDKWEHQSTSREAHPHKLFDDRAKDYQSVRKVIYEGTPTIKGRSPIERKRVAGSNCSYQVPCPHCKKYQALEFEGIKWDKDPDGRHNAEIAHNSARYECRHCGKECRDHHRAWMMRRGIWVPEGCTVKHKTALKYTEKLIKNPETHVWKGWKNARWIQGTPHKDGQDASYQLSSLYALSLGWGDIASEFVKSKSVPQWLRNFVNQWLGETWEIVERKQTWEELGKRLIVDVPRLTVPAGYSLVTAGIDKQLDHYVYVIDAWKEGRTSHTLAYGTAEELDEIREKVIDAKFAHADGGRPLQLAAALIDARYRPHDVYLFCRELLKSGRGVYPSFGSGKSLGAMYRKTNLGKDSAMPGLPVIHVDTISSQDWLEKQLHTSRPGDPGATTLYEGSLAEHQDFLEQLLNDALVPKLDAQNYQKETWERIDQSIPNDYRDCKRYAAVAFLVALRGGNVKPRTAAAKKDKPKTKTQKKQAPKKTPFRERPGGWLNRA